MNILLTNDDGILAPGIAAMYHELVQLGDVLVVAPDSGQSAAAHAITVNKPVAVSHLHVHDQFSGYSVDGRPADCVKIAVQELASTRPDLVVSGINDGANVSINVLYSGTVAAAADGAFLGIPSIAVSLDHGEDLDFSRAAVIARRLIEAILAQGTSAGQLFNINIPRLDDAGPKGVCVAPQAQQSMRDAYTRFDGPDGRRYYWLDGAFDQSEDHSGDLHRLREGYVVVTPLQFNMTDQPRLEAMRDWEWPGVETLASGDAL